MNAAAPQRERLLLVGWPAADWDAIQPLITAGQMPHLAALAARGCAATLSVSPPDCHAALWTTLATGLLADRHGVLGDREERWDGGGVQPAGGKSWRAPAFWEVLEEAGFATACVGWPATAPGVDWPGRHVDACFAQASGSSFETWAMLPGAVGPAALRNVLRGLRIHPADGLRDQAAALLPGMKGIDTRQDQRPLLLEAALAQVGTVHAVATHLAETGWDALCVCHDLLHLVTAGHAGHAQGGIYAGLAARAYGFQDMMLGRLMALAGPGVTVMVVSAGAAPGQAGFVAAAGPGIAASCTDTAALADLAPTILCRFGLQADMDGTPVPSLCLSSATLRPVAVPPAPPRAAFAGILDDGYSGSLTAEQSSALERVATDRLFNLACVQMVRGALQEAAASLEQVRLVRPGDTGVLQRLAQCRALLGDAGACLPLAQALLAADPHGPFGHLVMGAWCVLTGDGIAAQPHLDRAHALGCADVQVLVRIGGVHMLRRQPAEAERLFRDALELAPEMVEALHGLGVALAAQGDLDAAEKALRRGIARQPAQPLARLQLAEVMAGQGRWREALAMLDAVQRQSPAAPGLQASLIRVRTGLAQQIASDATSSVP